MILPRPAGAAPLVATALLAGCGGTEIEPIRPGSYYYEDLGMRHQASFVPLGYDKARNNARLIKAAAAYCAIPAETATDRMKIHYSGGGAFLWTLMFACPSQEDRK